jgi:signal transduction histidine kinase
MLGIAGRAAKEAKAMNPRMREVFYRLKDGLLIVSRAGRVNFASPAARKTLRILEGDLLPEGDLAQAVRDAAHSGTRLPRELQFTTPGVLDRPDTVRATLLDSPVGDDFVVIVVNETASQVYDTTLRNMLEVARAQLLEPLERFNRALGGLTGSASAASEPQDAEEGRAAGLDVARKLGKLLDLAQALGDNQIVGEERILPHELAQEAMRAVRGPAEARRVRLAIVGSRDDVPAIYGSRHWLTRAFCELLENAIWHGAEGAQIDVIARKSGQFASLRIRNYGRGIPPHLAERVFVPFHRMPRTDTSAEGMGVGLALARQIVELHGGHVRIEHAEDGATEVFVELPTGAPARARRDSGLEQAQLYAADMARLMARARSGAGTAASAATATRTRPA